MGPSPEDPEKVYSGILISELKSYAVGSNLGRILLNDENGDTLFIIEEEFLQQVGVIVHN